MTDNIDRAKIHRAIMTVKKQRYDQYRVYMDHLPERVCQWCAGKNPSKESFCSDQCKADYQKALDDYEARRTDKDHQRYSR